MKFLKDIFKFFFGQPKVEAAAEEAHDHTINFEHPHTFGTDTASLAIFDPEVLAHRLHAELDWLAESPFHQMPEVRAGDITLMGLGADGFYNILVFKNELPEELLQLRHKKLTVGVKIISGQCFIGNGESLPAGGNATLEHLRPHDGGILAIDNGIYDVEISAFEIEAEEEDDADMFLAIVFKARTGEFVAPTEEPHLDDLM